MATTKQQRKTLNAIMIVLAAVVVVAGVVFFMTVRGGQETSSPFVVSSKIGYANIERTGINYALDEGTALQANDVVETLDGSEIGLKGPGETVLYLADASKMQVNAPKGESSKTVLELVSGCIFADARSADDSLALEREGLAWTTADAVYVSDVRTSAVTVQVLAGEVAFEDGAVVKAGESRTVIVGQAQDSTGDSQSASAESASAESATPKGSSASSSSSSDFTAKLTLSSLNSFALQHALDTAKAGRELVFSEDQINGEIERRKNERLQQAEQAAAGDKAQNQNASGEQGNGATESTGAEGAGAGGETTGVPTADSATGEGSGGTSAADNGGSAGGDSSGGPAEDSAEAPAVDPTYTCTVQIRCDTILNNMDSLAEGKSKYVPRDGIILPTTYMQFTEGESAFDVLKRACDEYGIAVEYSFVPIYGSYYIEGIGNLYEFDCGDESGWMFKVNGWFPNYGCSEYALSDGDAVVFCYTCQGLGEDVGA